MYMSSYKMWSVNWCGECTCTCKGVHWLGVCTCKGVHWCGMCTCKGVHCNITMQCSFEIDTILMHTYMYNVHVSYEVLKI